MSSAPLIFISYAREADTKAAELCRALIVAERQGELRVWRDEKQLPPGAEFDKEIAAAIERSSIAILFITRGFLGSEYIATKELPLIRERALDGEIHVIPVLAETCEWKEHSYLKRLNVIPTARGGGHIQPVWDDAGHRSNALLTEVATSIIKIARGRAANGADAGNAPSSVDARPLKPVKVIEHELSDAIAEVLDDQGQLWLANSQLVRVYPPATVASAKPDTTHLPEGRWKAYLPQLWEQQFVLSDWDGNVMLVDRTDHCKALKPAFDGGTPVHLLAVGPDGDLAAASWDGTLLVWNTPSELRQKLRVQGLPTAIIPMRGSTVAVVEDHRRLSIFDNDGRILDSWLSDEPLSSLWPCEDEGEKAFIAQCGNHILVKYRSGVAVPEQIKFDSAITSLSHCGEQADNEWVCIAREGGAIDWVRETPFRVLKGGFQTKVPAAVASIIAVRSATEDSGVMAVGLSSDGRLFTVNGTKVRFHGLRARPDRITADKSGRLLVLSYSERAELYRNPGLRAEPPKLEVGTPKGKVAKDSVRRVGVTVTNKGSVTTVLKRAELIGHQMIDDCVDLLQRVTRPLPPAASLPVEFSVRALVDGNALTVTLRLQLEDETGAPLETVEMPVVLSTEDD